MPPPEAPPFAEPWQARRHALTLALEEAGAFGWHEWTEALGRRLSAPDAAPDGADHHERALAALADLLDAKGIAPREEVERLAAAWARAARETPHGEPVALGGAPGDATRNAPRNAPGA